MENKNILIGAGVVIAGYLLWKKSQKDTLKKREENLSQLSQQDTKTTSESKSVFSDVAIEKYAQKSADEFVSAVDRKINKLTLQPVEKVETTNDSKLDQLNQTLIQFRQEQNALKIQGLKKLKNNYGNIYLMFKKAIPKFKSVVDFTYAKNLLIKQLDESSLPTKEEQIWMANNQNLGESFGFDTEGITPQSGKKFAIASIGVQ
jgi:hypothetical protein